MLGLTLIFHSCALLLFPSFFLSSFLPPPVLVVASRGFVEACGLFIAALGLLSSCSARVPERLGSTLQHVGSLVEARELHSCGPRA